MEFADKKIIVANWKMNPDSYLSALNIYQEIKRIKEESRSIAIICPPALWLMNLSREKSFRNLYWGAQDCSAEKEGAWTGQISAKQLASNQIDFCLIGHSETRIENDELIIAKKVKMALRADLNILLCLGESFRDEEGEYLKELQKQVEISLQFVSKKNLTKIIICYEPLFAIGAQEADSPESFIQSALFIKKVIGNLYGQKLGQAVRVLYGGSVNKQNAEDFLAIGADGLLVGRESLKPKAFVQIWEKVDKFCKK